MEDEQPAGWYPSPDPARRATHARYWDGSRWTDHEILIDAALSPETGSADDGSATDHVAVTAEHGPPQPVSEPLRPGGGRRLLGRLAVVLLMVAVTLPGVAIWLERADASGPVVFIFEDETVRNALIAAPELAVTSGEMTVRRRLHIRQDGTFTILPGVTWSLDEPLEIELIPAYPMEPSGRVVLQLRENGADPLAQGWAVRVRIVATDRAFDVQVSQPVVSGIQRSREVVHQSAVPRSNEQQLIAVIEAETAARNEAISARQACVREERGELTELAAPAVGLSARYQAALDARQIYGTGSITFDEFRRRIRNLASDMQQQVGEAERALERLPQPVIASELTAAVATYATLREAWLDFERALRTPRDGPGATFGDLYPSQWSEVVRLEGGVFSRSSNVAVETNRRISEFATTMCEERHPLPGAG